MGRAVGLHKLHGRYGKPSSATIDAAWHELNTVNANYIIPAEYAISNQ